MNRTQHWCEKGHIVGGQDKAMVPLGAYRIVCTSIFGVSPRLGAVQR
jgi:hypothetical protein